MCRGFFTSATVGGDDKAKEAQKTAGNPYAPTSSAGGTPSDNKDDEGQSYLNIMSSCIWNTCGVHCNLQIMHATGFIQSCVNA